MHIFLKAVTHQQRHLPTAIVGKFGPAGGTIGRAQHHALALPDPDRYISRNHAEVCLQDQGFVIRNISASGGIQVGDRWLGQGECAPLKPGVTLLIGDYALEVESDAATAEAAARWQAQTAHRDEGSTSHWQDALVAASPGPHPPFEADLGFSGDPLEALLAGDIAGGDRPDGLASLPGGDPLWGSPFPSWAPAGSAPAPAGWPQPDPGDQLPAQAAACALPLLPAHAPLLSLAPTPTSTTGNGTHTDADTNPDAVKAEPASAPASHSAEAAGWAAFCEGAGLPLSLHAGSGPDRLRAVGQVLRSAISGTLDLLQMRAEFKKELRGDVTTFARRDNNPLKFSVSPERAMEQLVQAASAGYLAGPQAMDSAMHDLKAHAASTMAGLQGALFGLLEQLDPAAHEAAEPRHPVLDTLLPWRRQARLWARSRQAHDLLCNRVVEDFNAAVGQSLMRAYEAQLTQGHGDTIC